MKVRIDSSQDSGRVSSRLPTRGKRRDGIFDALLNEGVGQEATSPVGGAAVGDGRTARSLLTVIATGFDLQQPEQATEAVRRSAVSLLEMSFSDKMRSAGLNSRMLEDIAEVAAGDPRFHRKMLSILSRLKAGE